MVRYIIKRFVQVIPVLIGTYLVAFFILRAVPGDPASALVGFSNDVEAYERVRHQLHLDEPIYLQFLSSLTDLVQGNFGVSISKQVPVTQLVIPRLAATFTLLLTALGISLVGGILIGCITAVKQNSWLDNLSMIATYIAVSVPGFWLGLILIIIFSVNLGWLPVLGRGNPPDIQHLILPALAAAVPTLASTARLTRASMLEVLSADYVRLAMAKGVRPINVVFKHALRNALIPVVTVTGIYLGRMLAGNVVIEVIFGWPGIGTLLYDAIRFLDYPVIQGGMVFLVFSLVMVNLLIDIIYTVIDPRIKYLESR